MTDQKKKHKALVTRQNVLESLKDLGASATDDFFKDLLGVKQIQEKRSGDITAGESIQMSEALSGSVEENRILRLQIINERRMAQEEQSLKTKRINELRVHLQALMVEISKLSQSTEKLAESAQIAVFQAPSNPGEYHIKFFENILSFLQSFRKKIEESSIWLTTANKRSEKKNYWNMYKKKGSSFLLSPDHYLQRSAG